MKNTSNGIRLLKSQRARVLGMLIFLILAVAIGIFAYDHYNLYEGYPYQDGYGEYHASYTYDGYYEEYYYRPEPCY